MNPPRLPKLSVIVPNYNGEKLIPKFFPSVLTAFNNYEGDKELIVVDDCSSDNSISEINKFNGVQLIVRKENGGFPKCCNTGIHASSGDILFLLNTDVELSGDFFNYFPDHFTKEDTFALTALGYHYKTGKPLDGGKIGLWKRGNIRVTKNYYPEDYPSLQQPYLSFGVQGAYFFMDSKKLKQLGGGLDELYSPYIFEETDISYRAMKRGWKIYFEPRMTALHDHSTTINSSAKKSYIKTISIRNKLMFTWANIHSTPLLISHIFQIIFRLCLFNRSYWGGTLQALSLLPEILEKRKREINESTVSDHALLTMMESYLSR